MASHRGKRDDTPTQGSGPDVDRLGQAVASRVIRFLQSNPVRTEGFRLIQEVRRGLDRYYYWAVRQGRETLFFAGRSVLHRIEQDFQARNLGAVEDVIARRLAEGARISILFLDPTSDLLERLACEEGQRPEDMLRDLETSVGICMRLYERLRDVDLAGASLEIRIFDEIPYFAYHESSDGVIVGFYFSTQKGSETGAYELVDGRTKAFFGNHFLSIFDRARDSWLVRVLAGRNRVELNTELLLRIRACFGIHPEPAEHRQSQEEPASATAPDGSRTTLEPIPQKVEFLGRQAGQTDYLVRVDDRHEVRLSAASYLWLLEAGLRRRIHGNDQKAFVESEDVRAPASKLNGVFKSRCGVPIVDPVAGRGAKRRRLNCEQGGIHIALKPHLEDPDITAVPHLKALLDALAALP